MGDRANVPCGSCRLCCQQQLVILTPEAGDIVESYEVEWHGPLSDGEKFAVLKHKPNGDCIYLGDSGCTIHARAPAMCKQFDCRKLYLQYPTRQARRRVLRERWGRRIELASEVFEAGRERLASLNIEAER